MNDKIKLWSLNKEILLYLLFGVLSFVLNIVLFTLLNNYFAINELISNIIAWIIVVLFVFVTNRKYVFISNNEESTSLFKQLFEFYAGRIITLAIEEVIIFVFISRLEFPSIIVKLAAQVVVTILNYFISKLIIFKKR